MKRESVWFKKMDGKKTFFWLDHDHIFSTTSFQHLQEGGLHSTEVAFLLLTKQPQVWFLALPKIYFDVAEINRRHWLKESGQRLENDARTHPNADTWATIVVLSPTQSSLMMKRKKESRRKFQSWNLWSVWKLKKTWRVRKKLHHPRFIVPQIKKFWDELPILKNNFTTPVMLA